MDTSIWVEHLHAGRSPLTVLLQEGRVLTHSFVIGELACGHLTDRDEILHRLGRLRSAPMAEHEEVLAMIRRDRLQGMGLGWVDVHLLASARLAGAGLLTLDAKLRRAAVRLQCSVVI